jgi:hypothetical protein
MSQRPAESRAHIHGRESSLVGGGGATNSNSNREWGTKTMSDSVKIREQRVRRALARSGMRLRKAPREVSLSASGYMIVDDRDNIRDGGDLRRVEWFAFEHSAECVSPA